MSKVLAMILCAAMLSTLLFACGRKAAENGANDPPSSMDAPGDADAPSPDLSAPTAGEEEPSPGGEESSQEAWQPESGLNADADAASDADADSDNSSGSGSVDSDDGSGGYGVDFDAAFSTFAPDTVMIRAGEYIITWEEFFVQLFGHISSVLEAYGGMLPDWSEQLENGQTYAEAIMEYALEYAMMYKAIEYGAERNGVGLDQDDLEFIQTDFDSGVELFGGLEELGKYLWEEYGYYSIELYKYFLNTGYLGNKLFDTLYIADDALQDEDIAEYIAMDGFMMAKHILRLKPEEGEDTAITEMEAILDQLNSYDGADFESFFDELMKANSEDDGGLTYFPDGYLFQYDDMNPLFSEACESLEIGELSGVIDAGYGYHIIYRLQIDYDTIPFANYMQEDYSTLRYLVASRLFSTVLHEWTEILDAEKTPEFDSIDIAGMFAMNNT